MVLLLGLTQVPGALSAAYSDGANSLLSAVPAPAERMSNQETPTPTEYSHLAGPGHQLLDQIPAVEECEDDFGEDSNRRILLEYSIPFPAHHGRVPLDFRGPPQNLLVRSLPIRGPPDRA